MTTLKITTTKICIDCKKSKVINEYYTKGKSATTEKIYYEAYCKNCSCIRSVKKTKNKMKDPDYRKDKNAEYSKWQRENRIKPEKRANYIVIDSRRSDKKKGLENDLDKDWVNRVIADGCMYCGENNIRMTLDRIDNSLGHIKSNVNPSCNLVRGNMPYNAWIIVASAMRAAKDKNLFGEWTGEFSFTR